MVSILADTTLRTRDLDEAAARAAVARNEKQLDGRALPKEEYERPKNELRLSTKLLRAIYRLGAKNKS